MLLLRRGGRLHQDALLWRVQPPLQTARTMLWRMWTYVKSNSAHGPNLGSLILNFLSFLVITKWLCMFLFDRLFLQQCSPHKWTVNPWPRRPLLWVYLPGSINTHTHTFKYTLSELISSDNVSCFFSYRPARCDVGRSRVQRPPVLTRSPTHVAALSVTVTSSHYTTAQVM